MLCIGLLNADLQAEGLEPVGRVESFRLTAGERDRFAKSLPGLDALVADLNLINVDSFQFLSEFEEKLHERVSQGALLLCFTSRPNLHSPKGVKNKYAWLPFFDGEKEVHEDLVDKISIRANGNAAAGALSTLGASFYATCSFPNGFGTEPYETVLEGDEGSPVGLAKQLGQGLVLLLPQSEDKAAVLAEVLGWWADSRGDDGPSRAASMDEPSPAPAIDPSAWAQEVGKVTMTHPSRDEEAEDGSPDAEIEALPQSAGEEEGTAGQGFEVSTADAGVAVGEEGAEPIDLATDGAATDLSELTAEPGAEAADDRADESSEEAPPEDRRLVEIRQELKMLMGPGFSQYEDLPLEELEKLYETQMNAASQSVFDDARDELEALLDKPAETESEPAPTPPEPGTPPQPEEPAEAAKAAAAPPWLADLKADLPNLTDLYSEAEQLEQQATELRGQAQGIRDQIAALSRWDGLLFEQGQSLLNLVRELFSDVFAAQVSPAAEEPPAGGFKASGGDYEFLVHLATSAEPVADEAGRELLRHLADADVDTKGILVVNGALGSAPPEKGSGHVKKSLLSLASKRGLLIIPVDALFRAGLASQREEGWQPEPILDSLASQSGLYGQG